MPTMDDVARLSGFSQMTVSRAFLASAPIRAETRERILKVAAEIGYYHNKAASSLASRPFAGLRHHPADAAGLDLPALRRGRPPCLRARPRRLRPADHRLRPRARSARHRRAPLAPGPGDPACPRSVTRRRPEGLLQVAADSPDRGRQPAEAADPFRRRPFRFRGRLSRHARG